MTPGTVLVADRGAPAVRVVRAVRDAGLRSVAVYADPDIDALHTRLADEAYRLDAQAHGLGGGDTEQRHRDTARLLEIARRSGADAVHPGGGALAGSAGFARTVIGAGLTWVGPDPETIEMIGDPARMGATAARLGVAGKAPWRPRHLEVQVLGDRHGRVAMLGTRDVSLRRRGSTLVGEAPAPAIDDRSRNRIHGVAAGICRAVRYTGAGTVEFLLGADGALSLLGIDPALRVEHALTEEVTGIDLVREQLRIAAGAPTDVPDPAPVRGHAIGFRVCAEDPALGFLPAAGAVERFATPGGPGVRLDPGVVEGQAVPGSFDTLLATLVVRGRDRAEALARARRALAETRVEGVATVLPLHRFLVSAPAFAPEDGTGPAVHNRWVEEECDAELAPAPRAPEPDEARLVRVPVEVDGRRIELGLPEGLAAMIWSAGGDPGAV